MLTDVQIQKLIVQFLAAKKYSEFDESSLSFITTAIKHYDQAPHDPEYYRFDLPSIACDKSDKKEKNAFLDLLSASLEQAEIDGIMTIIEFTPEKAKAFWKTISKELGVNALQTMYERDSNLSIRGKHKLNKKIKKHWLNDQDLVDMIKLCGLEGRISTAPLCDPRTPDALRNILFAATKKAKAANKDKREHTIPFLLNVGQSDDKTSQGSHWIWAIIKVNLPKIHISLGDSSSLSKESLQEYTAAFKEALSSSLFNISVEPLTYDAMTNDGWACGYIAFYKLINDPTFQLTNDEKKNPVLAKLLKKSLSKEKLEKIFVEELKKSVSPSSSYISASSRSTSDGASSSSSRSSTSSGTSDFSSASSSPTPSPSSSGTDLHATTTATSTTKVLPATSDKKAPDHSPYLDPKTIPSVTKLEPAPELSLFQRFRYFISGQPKKPSEKFEYITLHNAAKKILDKYTSSLSGLLTIACYRRTQVEELLTQLDNIKLSCEDPKKNKIVKLIEKINEASINALAADLKHDNSLGRFSLFSYRNTNGSRFQNALTAIYQEAINSSVKASVSQADIDKIEISHLQNLLNQLLQRTELNSVQELFSPKKSIIGSADFRKNIEAMNKAESQDVSEQLLHKICQQLQNQIDKYTNIPLNDNARSVMKYAAFVSGRLNAFLKKHPGHKTTMRPAV